MSCLSAGCVRAWLIRALTLGRDTLNMWFGKKVLFVRVVGVMKLVCGWCSLLYCLVVTNSLVTQARRLSLRSF